MTKTAVASMPVATTTPTKSGKSVPRSPNAPASSRRVKSRRVDAPSAGATCGAATISGADGTDMPEICRPVPMTA